MRDFISISPTEFRFFGLMSVRPSNFVSAGINILLGLSGVVAFLSILIGGLQWILAGGDKEGVDKAKRRIVGALAGLTVVFSSYALLFIIRALFGIDLIAVSISRIY